MPYIINRPRGRGIALIAACLGLLVAAAPAAAATSSSSSSSCVFPASSPVFTSLGDTANYFAVPGGTFEAGTTGWSLTGAQIVSGNEPFQVSGLSDSQSLSIAPGGVATSPTVCINSLAPTWRFFAHVNGSAPASQLTVYAQWNDPKSGKAFKLPIAHTNAKDYASWAATPALVLGKALPKGLDVNIQLSFQASANGSAWSIDDVFIDPYAR